MGYYSNGYGELTLSRPLIPAEFKDSDLASTVKDTILRFQIDTERVPVPEGVLVKESVSRVVWRYEEQCKMYSLDGEVADLAGLLGKLGVSAKGVLTRVGEENGDVERHWIEGGVARREKAKLIWPSTGEEVSY